MLDQQMLGQYNLNPNPSMWWEQLPKFWLQRLTHPQRFKCGRPIGTLSYGDFRKEVLFGWKISRCAMRMA
jgi:hypothetical protein